MVKILPLSDAKAGLSELVEEAVRTHERVSITRHGKPAAVLVAAEDLDGLEETLHWLARPDVAVASAAADALLATADPEQDDGPALREALVRHRRSAG